LLVSIALAALVPQLVRSLARQGLVSENYRGASVASPTGIAIVVVALAALVPLLLVQELTTLTVLLPETEGIVAYVMGVALLGLLDDVVGGRAPAGSPEAALGPPRGWRGHARVTARGGLSTGALKAVGTLGLALLVLAAPGVTFGEYAISVLLLVVTTNLFNLLDLRPGRSAKALVLLGLALVVGSRDLDPLWALGLFLGPILLLLPIDLRERGMLGDTGSNAIGGVAGLWLVLTLPMTGELIALAAVLIATVYGEFRSISTLIERTPGLRQLDSLGRSTHA
jgi:hypothetical protein